MDILKTFVFDHTPHEVCIQRDGNGDPLFKASDIGKVLSITNVRPSIADFDEHEARVSSTYTSAGDRKATFLTEQGVFKLIMRSRKPVAKPFQNWVFEVLKTIRKTGRYALEEEVATLKRKHAEALVDADADAKALVRKYMDSEDERIHKTLVEGFENRTCVYFGKIMTMDDDSILVKIGSTKNIRSRTTGLAKEFGSMSIFRVFECDRYEKFEKFLHNHVDIRRYLFKKPINGKRSMEVFCMTKEEVKRAENIAVRGVFEFRFNQKGFGEALLEQPSYRALLKKNGIDVNTDIDNIDTQPESKRGRCTLTGDKIQAYSTDGKALVFTYNTRRDAVRDVEGASDNGILRACEEKVVRFGHRWARLSRTQPDDTVQDIGVTVSEVGIRTGHVAALDDDKSFVHHVYTSFKACALKHRFKSGGAVQKRSKRGAKVGGYHMVSWSELPESVQNKWLETNTLPTLAKNATSKPINRLDPVTKEVLRTYSTMDEVARHFKIGRVKLRTAISGDLERFGFKWAYAD